MLDYEDMQVVERWLGVAVDMCHDPFEDLRFVAGLASYICIQVLQFDLLPPKIVGKATKGRTAVFFPILAVKLVAGDALPDRVGILL
jgi:hypothetical protein